MKHALLVVLFAFVAQARPRVVVVKSADLAPYSQVTAGFTAEVKADVSDVLLEEGADAAQKARRTLLEIDAMLEEAEGDKRWPELDEEARESLSWSGLLIAKWGTPAEQQLFNEATQAVEKARASRHPIELQRQLRVVRNLRMAAFYRDPKVWDRLFEAAASEADRATDIVKAQALVRDGKKAQGRGDMQALKPIVETLWELLPVTAQSKKLGYDSGVR